jgi:crotonobetainyl-CoA:carnitine CoA-transferase CaiB-like acyl-CoA transferase
MYDVMAGIRVIEVAEYTFAPAAAMILADWGADVIKVERLPRGDSLRDLRLPGADALVNPFFEAGNRGKRSIGIDLHHAEGRAQLYRLVAGADVFVTSLRGSARQKMGIEPADLLMINPKLIYARGTGYGLRGTMADDAGFDYPSTWCRAGAAFAQTLPGGEPPKPPSSIGDLAGGATLAGAIAAALFRRERTGRGAIVDNALYQVGTYLMSQSLLASSIGAPTLTPHRQLDATIALANSYRTRDGRWVALSLLREDWWPDLTVRLGRQDLQSDARFIDGPARHVNAGALVVILNEVFASADYAEWCVRLATLQGVWAPLQNPAEVLADTQATANGFVSRVEIDSDSAYMTGVSPGQFDERAIGKLSSAPGFAQHTDEILIESGLDGDAIAALRAAGVVC